MTFLVAEPETQNAGSPEDWKNKGVQKIEGNCDKTVDKVVDFWVHCRPVFLNLWDIAQFASGKRSEDTNMLDYSFLDI